MKTHQTQTTAIEEAKHLDQGEPVDDRPNRLRSLNPADTTVVGEVDWTDAEESAPLLERARETQRAWKRRPLSTRIERGRQIVHEILEWRRELLELVVDETGKSSLEARRELWEATREAREILSKAQQRLESEADGRWWTPGRQSESSWAPRGTVLVVASSYDPVQTTLGPALAAIVAGNSVIVVAHEDSPLVVKSLSNIVEPMGIPDRLWNGVVGGRRLVADVADGADAIVSYGSPALTRKLARRQGERMVPVFGRWKTRDAMVVLSDANIERAARAAVCGCCGGAGRSRRTLRRIYVQQSVADPFVDAVVEEVGTLRQSNRGDQEGFEVGPLSDVEQLQHLEQLVDDASRKGARLVAGGRIRPRCRGHYFEPTVLTDVDESMRLWQEGGPGPVVAIAPVEAPAEAVGRIRDVDGYGAVSLFTANTEVARNLAGGLRAPVVGINEVVRDVPPASPPVRGTIDGPIDPVGADRLQALSRRILTVEKRWPGLPSILETRTPERMEKALDTALSAVYRRGWLRKTVDTIVPDALSRRV